MFIVAQVVYQPCLGIEEGSWLWYLKGCFWIMEPVAVVGVAVAVGLTGAAVWAISRSSR